MMILKRVNKSIFFQSNKFIACQGKMEEIVKSFMIFNLLKINISFKDIVEFKFKPTRVFDWLLISLNIQLSVSVTLLHFT